MARAKAPPKSVTIPYMFYPRPYQLQMMVAMDNGVKRVVLVWHRRSGKDKACVNVVFKKMMERTANYFYIFPTYKQGKKALWQGIDKKGFKTMGHMPKEFVMRRDNTEMMIEVVDYKKYVESGGKVVESGSTFQVVGSDNVDSIVGSNPAGIVFSEYSLQDPGVWDYLRPILAENEGWAIFNFTPRGRNHAYKLLEYAKRDPAWFSQVLTVEDTGAIKRSVLEQERREIIAKNGDDALYLQEYMCDFNAPIQGAYYGAQLRLAEQEGRIGVVPYDDMLPVHTAWDLGIDDSMTIWFYQLHGGSIRVIDYLEATGEGLAYYVKRLKEKPYIYGDHNAPHDIKVRELGTGKSRYEVARQLGITFRVAKKIPVMDGIDAARSMFRRCWFDAERCERGVDALRSYHKEWDDFNKTYKNKPKHDWASHGADAFRVMAVTLQDNYGGSGIEVTNKGVDQVYNDYWG